MPADDVKCPPDDVVDRWRQGRNFGTAVYGAKFGLLPIHDAAILADAYLVYLDCHGTGRTPEAAVCERCGGTGKTTNKSAMPGFIKTIPCPDCTEPEAAGAAVSLTEVFEVGYELHAFLFSSHCYDARDVGRFFVIDGLPEWAKSLGKKYDETGVWNKPKDAGVFAIMKVFRDALAALREQPPASAETGDTP